MSFTIASINTLRKKTGAGIMDCKKALKASSGDFEKAVAFLRKQGKKILESRSDRNTKEGAIFIDMNNDNTLGVMIALGCETDFVAKNSDFQALGKWITSVIIQHFKPNSNIDTILAIKQDEITVQEKIIDIMGKIGEKITLNSYEFIQDEMVIPYLHTGNTIGTLVGIQGGKNVEDIIQVGQNIAMQIAAMHPIAIDRYDVDKDLMQKEFDIAKAQAQKEGKPEVIIEKIAQGRVNKFLQENTLLNQSFVQDSTLSVKKYLQKIGKDIKITAFKRLSIF